MADSKISALPASTTPLAGTEVLPIVQSSATKQVSVANLTAGRAISATQLTLTTGNLIVASGQGIDFSATSSGSGTMTSELLNDYEEGTWTPSLGGDTTYTTQTGTYVKIGRLVHVEGKLLINVLGTGSATTVSGLPFTQFLTGSGVTGKGDVGYFQGIATALSSIAIDVQNNTDTFVFVGTVVAAVTATYSPSVFQSGTRVDFAITYEAN